MFNNHFRGQSYKNIVGEFKQSDKKLTEFISQNDSHNKNNIHSNLLQQQEQMIEQQRYCHVGYNNNNFYSNSHIYDEHEYHNNKSNDNNYSNWHKNIINSNASNFSFPNNIINLSQYHQNNKLSSKIQINMTQKQSQELKSKQTVNIVKKIQKLVEKVIPIHEVDEDQNDMSQLIQSLQTMDLQEE